MKNRVKTFMTVCDIICNLICVGIGSSTYCFISGKITPLSYWIGLVVSICILAFLRWLYMNWNESSYDEDNS